MFRLMLPALLFSSVTLAKTTLQESSIIYQGMLNQADNSQVKTWLEQYKHIDTIEVSSGGGLVSLGMDLAELIEQHALRVKLSGFCFSSCANYILLSGQPTVIQKGAVIGWHGDANSARWRDSDIDDMVSDLNQEQRNKKWIELRAHYDAVIEQLSKREQLFYDRLGVNHELLTYGFSSKLVEKAKVIKARGWSYTPSVLKSFGVKNVNFDEWQPRSPKNFPLLIIDSVDSSKR